MPKLVVEYVHLFGVSQRTAVGTYGARFGSNTHLIRRNIEFKRIGQHIPTRFSSHSVQCDFETARRTRALG